ncbi:MAG: F0F1 ATP synthase subunit A [bacterium]
MGAEIEVVKVFWQLSLFGLDISISSAVLVIWAAVLLILFFGFLAVLHAKVVPGKTQNMFELLFDFWEEQTKDVFQEDSARWLPFVFSLFLFVLVCNLLALIPNVYPITANINITVTLAALVFVVYHYAGISKNGLGNYLKALLPQGVPFWLMPFLILIEIISHLARPFSLAIRLFANMTAGHLVTFTFLSLIILLKSSWLAGFPLLGRLLVGLFEFFVAFVQAYVFAYLAALYIGLAVTEETQIN